MPPRKAADVVDLLWFAASVVAVLFSLLIAIVGSPLAPSAARAFAIHWVDVVVLGACPMYFLTFLWPRATPADTLDAPLTRDLRFMSLACAIVVPFGHTSSGVTTSIVSGFPIMFGGMNSMACVHRVWFRRMEAHREPKPDPAYELAGDSEHYHRITTFVALAIGVLTAVLGGATRVADLPIGVGERWHPLATALSFGLRALPLLYFSSRHFTDADRPVGAIGKVDAWAIALVLVLLASAGEFPVAGEPVGDADGRMIWRGAAALALLMRAIELWCAAASRRGPTTPTQTA